MRQMSAFAKGAGHSAIHTVLERMNLGSLTASFNLMQQDIETTRETIE